MIVDLPDTSTTVINKQLVDLRGEGGAVALGRVLTLIIDTTDADEEAAIAAANEVSYEHPCRIIAVGGVTRNDKSRLDAQIRLGGDAGASEAINLTLHGDLVDHSESVVNALILPDAPIVTWWPEDVPQVPSTSPLGAMATRRITDSATASTPRATLTHLAKQYARGDTDLAWTRLTKWRALLAAALDQPPFEPVEQAIVAGEPANPSVALMAAWLELRLRCPVICADHKGALGLTRVELVRRSGSIVINRPGSKIATLEQPGQPSRTVSLPHRSESECLAEELRRMEPDPVYEETLKAVAVTGVLM